MSNAGRQDGGSPSLFEEFSRSGRRGSAASLSFSGTVARRLGLSRTAVECLDLLKAEGPMSAGRLGALTGLSSGAVTGVVDRLVQRGLATRDIAPDDRRKVTIAACDGPADAVAVYAPLLEQVQAFVADYSPEEITTYIQMTQDLADRVFDAARQVREGGLAVDNSST